MMAGMRKALTRAALAAALLAGSGASWSAFLAATAPSNYGRIYTYQDWAVACDNTHRCEAAGYQTDDDAGEPVAIFLSREAGPQGRIEAKVTFAEAAGAPLTLAVGKLKITDIEEDKPLTASQTAQLLPWLVKGRDVKLSDGTRTWTVSLAGAAAALLKMDDLQGRVDTPGAIVRKGKQPESSVPPAVPAPMVKPIALPPEQPRDANLLKPILAAIKNPDFCEDPEFGREHAAQAQLTRLSATKVLVTTTCWQGAYQDGSGAWLADDKPPYSPVKVRWPAADGSTESEPTFLDIDPNGHAYSSHKGRGIGDCIFTTEWGWTGDGFALVSTTSAGLCKGFAGGLQLRLWTTRGAATKAAKTGKSR